MRKLENLDPGQVFFYFEELCRIPHGSGNTEAVSDYLTGFAAEHGLSCLKDDAGNVVIRKEGSEGYEKAAPVILQGHMDMVCEKTAASAHDFTSDPLDLYVEDGFVRARDTTLGGDDGIFVAMALAILSDDTLSHPPIEALFTVDEEIGLLGAKAFDCSVLRGKRMINLDSEEEGVFLTSCAGGGTAGSHIPVSREQAEGADMVLSIGGLLGGHSGAEIHKGRANASVLMGRLLNGVREVLPYRLYAMTGGTKDNAITNLCTCGILINEEDKEALREYCARFEQDLHKEYAGTDPDIRVTAEDQGTAVRDVLTIASCEKVLFYLRFVPWSVQKMSGTIPGLVETSSNPGVLSLTDEEFFVGSGVRSSVSSAKEDIIDKIRYLTEFLGGEFTLKGDYPAWEYREESPLRELCVRVYQEKTGSSPRVEAIHAGLECGLFYENIEGLDCISMGPDILDIHTFNEHLDIASVQRTYDFLLTVLKEMKD